VSARFPRILGLTGSIGMGKSTTSAMFRDEGAAVYDADAAVHAIYDKGGSAVGPVGEAFPGSVVDGRVDRTLLSPQVMGNPEALKRLEGLVHPLLAEHRARFFEQALKDGAKIVVLDVPLLFETGGDRGVDAVAVVSAPAEVQKDRVLARPDMNEDKLAAILARQTPDAEKRRRADFVIDTSQGLDAARDQVRQVVARLLEPDFVSTRPKD
jgi:dephospho-CoA kinase